jgi:hypothetical protein
MASVFSWLAQLAGYLRKPVVSAVVAGAVATGIPTLALVIRNTRTTGIVLRGFGTLFLACGLVLVYVKFRVPAVKVPPTWLSSRMASAYAANTSGEQSDRQSH